MRASIARAATDVIAALIAVLCLAVAVTSGAMAQSPAVNKSESDFAKEQQAQQISQPGNNQPVWKEIRTGEPQITNQQGREADILMDPRGQTWRALRNGQVSVFGGWALVVVVLAIAAFYWRKGRMELHEPPTGRLLKRFAPWERMIHWSTAISFLTLAFSGLIILFGKSILLPVIGYTLFSWLAILAKNLHNFVGPLFVICLMLIFVTFVRDNIPQSGDFEWIKRFGGLFSGHEIPSHRFNAGEKVWFWGGVFTLGIVSSVTGLILDFPNFNQLRTTMQIANILHLVSATLFMMGALGHIYLGTIGMAGALDGMKTGYVDETWAKEHHEYWYNDVKAGRIAADGGDAGLRQRPA